MGELELEKSMYDAKGKEIYKATPEMCKLMARPEHKQGTRMYLNKQGVGKIDWCDYTWNPIGGKCYFDCEYCYMKALRARFKNNEKINSEPFLDEKVLNTKFPEKPSIIFVCSANDMFGDWVRADWIERILEIIKRHSEHIFMLLTKNPNRYSSFNMIGYVNMWLGTTFDGLDATKYNIRLLRNFAFPRKTFVSFEPLLNTYEYADLYGIDWIILGADSRVKKVQPEIVMAGADIIREADKRKIPVWVKDNFRGLHKIKELPIQLLDIRKDMARSARAL